MPERQRTTSTVENYLKSIYEHQQRGEEKELVSLGLLAESLGVTAGTATTMIKRLSENGLVAYEPRMGVRLSPDGEEIALDVLRRHRLIELFLVRFLDYDWGDVHEEAEILEHSVSDRLLARIDEKLGHPKLDPHGDPIPDSTGRVPDRELLPLSDCEEGDFRIARISDQSSEFLRFLDRKGLTPGTRLEVVDRDGIADLVTVQPSDGEPVRVGMTAARKIFVTPDDPFGF